MENTTEFSVTEAVQAMRAAKEEIISMRLRNQCLVAALAALVKQFEPYHQNN